MYVLSIYKSDSLWRSNFGWIFRSIQIHCFQWGLPSLCISDLVIHMVNRRPIAFKEVFRDSSDSNFPDPITPEMITHHSNLTILKSYSEELNHQGVKSQIDSFLLIFYCFTIIFMFTQFLFLYNSRWSIKVLSHAYRVSFDICSLFCYRKKYDNFREKQIS